VIEATYGWYWAVDALLAARFEVHLAPIPSAAMPPVTSAFAARQVPRPCVWQRTPA
jgi:hypothetical protein